MVLSIRQDLSGHHLSLSKIGERHSFSFFLLYKERASAATDRWPLVVIFEMVQMFFDRSFASSVVNSALAFNLFPLPWVARR